MRKVDVILDSELVQKCLQKTGIQTVKALLDHALRELLNNEHPKKALDLKGNTRWGDNLKKKEGPLESSIMKHRSQTSNTG